LWILNEQEGRAVEGMEPLCMLDLSLCTGESKAYGCYLSAEVDGQAGKRELKQ
jgi:hypothetical protein